MEVPERAGLAAEFVRGAGGPCVVVGRTWSAGARPDDAPPVAVAVEHGAIAFIGAPETLPDRFAHAPRCDAGLVTPGLVDAHTHAAWVGSRHHEYVQKLAGEGYEVIAARGGGIVASMRAIEAATEDEIVRTLRARLTRMAAMGVTTVEVKSGYGLRPALERKQLRAIAEVGRDPQLPRIVPTFLALHALPPESRVSSEARAAYVEGACREVGPVAREGLARFVDAYVDRNAFTVEEARKLAIAARDAGLPLRLHVGQFADVGGAELAAEFRARSVDHLENVGARGRDALAAAGVFATLLPTASFVLDQAPPDVPALRAAGVRMCVASDANPGTAPTESLPLAMALAARTYRLTLDEVLSGATCHAAASLDLPGHGALAVGRPADLVAWDLPHEAALIAPWGTPRATLVLRDGIVIGGDAIA